MWRGLSTGSKVRVGIIGVGLVGVFGYALAQGQRTIGDDADEAFARMHDDDDDDLFGSPRDRGSSLDTYAAEEAAVRRTDGARRAASALMLGEHAQPGRAFDGVAWRGAVPLATEEALDLAASRVAPFAPTIATDEASGELRVEMGNPLRRDEVAAAWGAADRGGDTWIDADRGTCATLSLTAITWRRCQSLEDLLGTEAPRQFGFEPSPIVGTRIAALRDALADSDMVEFDDRVRWHVAGLVEERSLVELTARFDRRGVVTRLEVVIPARAPEAVYAQLLERMEGHATWTTKGRTVTLQPASADGVMFTISR